MNKTKPVKATHALSVASDSISAQVFWVVTFALLTAVGAQIEIPYQPVPFTLQTMFVLLSGGLLGERNGSISMLLYLGLGLVGLPVFSGGGFGLIRMLGPTGGYLFAFPVAAYTAGILLKNRKNLLPIALSMFVSLAIIFLMGTLQLGLVLGNWSTAVTSGLLIFSVWDLVKLAAATGIVYQFNKSKA